MNCDKSKKLKSIVNRSIAYHIYTYNKKNILRVNLSIYNLFYNYNFCEYDMLCYGDKK